MAKSRKQVPESTMPDETQQKQRFLEVLTSNFGVLTPTCRATGIEKKFHNRWLIEDSDYRQKVEEIDSLLLDFAETQLYNQIKNGSIPAIIFTLKTKGKERGWIEKALDSKGKQQAASIFDKIKEMKKATG
jgi:hypothetical protein